MNPVLVLLVIACLVWVTLAICVVRKRRQSKPVPAPVAASEYVPEFSVPSNTEHRFLVCDRFDGLWETWICRDCGECHLRKRAGLD